MLDFNGAMTRFVSDIVRVVPEFSHINLRQLLVSASTSRRYSRSGLVAYLLPLRYQNGAAMEFQRRGKRELCFQMEPVILESTEILYVIYFLLPRFLNQTLREKIETVIHELYHINPSFNGDVRRLAGRSYLHGNSLREYDRTIARLTDTYLAGPLEPETYAFLKGRYPQIQRKFGSISAKHFKEPKPKFVGARQIGDGTRYTVPHLDS